MALLTINPKSKSKTPAKPAARPGELTAAHQAEQRRIDAALSTSFKYERLPTLAAARVRLAQLTAERSQAGERANALQAAYNSAQAALLKAQTAAALGEAQPGDVAAAAAAFEAARVTLTAHQPNGGALKAEARAVADRVDQLEREELEHNRRRLRPLYQAEMAKLDQALETARAASDAIRALRNAGGQAAQSWPAEWHELTPPLVAGAISTTRLEQWRKQARAVGLLD